MLWLRFLCYVPLMLLGAVVLWVAERGECDESNH